MKSLVSLKWPGVLALLTTGALAATAGGQERRAADPGVAEAAPVLARIVEKKLAAASSPVRSLQWARIPGRGLLFLADLEGFQPDLLGSERDWTPEELAWENVRRELLGRSPLVPGHAVMTRNALRGVQEALKRFAARVPLPSGETSRFVLFSRQGAGVCATCHAASSLPTAFRSINDWAPGEGLPLHEAAEPDRESFVAVEGATVWSGSNPQLALEAAMLARLLGRKLAQSFPDEFWGKDVHGRPGSLGVLAGDWGPAVVLNMTFPIATAADPYALPTADLWEQTQRELRGQEQRPAGSRVAPGGRTLPTASARPAVDAEALLGALREALVTFAPRLSVREDQEAMVLVFGGTPPIVFTSKPEKPYPGALQAGSVVPPPGQPLRSVHGLTDPARSHSLYESPRPDYVLVLPGAAILAHRAGELTLEQLGERVQVTVERP